MLCMSSAFLCFFCVRIVLLAPHTPLLLACAPVWREGLLLDSSFCLLLLGAPHIILVREEIPGTCILVSEAYRGENRVCGSEREG